jgi:hypothetical protein
MSLHNLAHHVRAKGRGKDTMLVHMTPQEVKGLQAIAKSRGGTLTINPETGLPEAGFLDDILPVVAMAAATYFTAGAAAPAIATALGPAAAGGAGLLSAGAATTAGGIIGGGLAGAGVGAIGAGLQGGDVGKGALYGGLGGAITGGMGGYDNVYGAAAATPDPNAVANAQNVQDLARVEASPNAGMQPPNAPGTSGGPPTPEFTQSFRPGVPTPSAVDDKAKAEAAKTIYQGFGGLGKTATLALPGIGGAMGEKPDEIPGEEGYSSKSTLSPNFQGYTPPQPDPYYKPQYTRYAASGGLMDAYQAGGPVERMSQMNTAMNPQGGLYPMGMIDKTQYATPTQRPVSAELVTDAPAYERSNPMLMARGGIADLGGYSDGGRMLRGPGDGMSDSIPGVIGGKQPARLADGEFVVPADVVSHLGNGSTDAGARKLYAMMDKIRKARTGKKKQAPAVKTSRFMPA